MNPEDLMREINELCDAYGHMRTVADMKGYLAAMERFSRQREFVLVMVNRSCGVATGAPDDYQKNWGC